MSNQWQDISRIGLGCVTFGREIDERASFGMMDYAVSKGVNFFDTAAAYGAGSSETIIGRWLTSRRPASGSIIIATKILPPYDPQKIIASVDESLKRLGTGTIDLLYLHSWDPSAEKIENLSALDALVRQGKVNTLGASNFNAEQVGRSLALQKANGFNAFGFIQNNNNLAVTDLTPETFNICRENEIGIVTYSPLGAGFLTGKYNREVPEGSRFGLIPGHQKIYFAEQSYRRLEKLKMIASHTGHSIIHLALAWALHQPGISSVLVGGRTSKHIEQAFEALKYYDKDMFAEAEGC